MKRSADDEQTNTVTLSTSWTDRYLSFLVRYEVWIYGLAILSTLLALTLTRGLELRTSFSELLPKTLASVQSLDRAATRIGGTGNLIVGVESEDFAANKKFMEDFARRVETLVGHEVRYFEYRYQDIREYIEKYALHYLSAEQLRQVQKDLEREIERNKDKAFGSFLGLGSTEEAEPTKTEKDYLQLAKIDPTLQKFLSYRESYLSADDGRLLAMTIRPFGSSLDVQSSKSLIKKVEDFIQAMDPKSYHPGMKVKLLGSVTQAVAEFESVKADIVDTAVLLVVLIVSVLFLYFWSFRAIGLLFLNLLVAVAWTFGMTKIFIGYLNTQTAFMGSLVVGTGINYGIIYLARYLELRREGLALNSAISQAIRSTLIPTFVASSTTAVSFVALMISSNKGFSQFGFMGGVGVLFCWATAMSLLPLWTLRLEKKFPSKIRTEHPLGRYFLSLAQNVGTQFTSHAKLWSVVILVFILGAIPGVMKLLDSPLEYNFDNVRNKVHVSPEVAEFRKRVQAIFPTSLTPSIVLVDNLDQARLLCPSIRQIQKSLPEEKNVIQSCMSLFGLIPEFPANPQEHQAALVQVQKTLGHHLLKYSDKAEIFEAMRKNTSLTPPLFESIPEQIKRRYTEKNGQVGLFAFINPDNSKPLQDGNNLLNFTESLTDFELGATGTRVSASGESFVLADLLRNIHAEGPRVSALAFVGVILIAVFLSGGLRAGLLMSFCLGLATWWMWGIQGFAGIKYNFFNFIALPLTFGIGVDYPINVYIRCRQEKFKNFGKIFASTGLAVTLCSTTTIIGYYTLLGASSQALASFGKIAIIGEFTCLLAALVVVPVALRLAGYFSDSRKQT